MGRNFSKSLFIKTFSVLIGFIILTDSNAQSLNIKKTERKARKALYKEKYTDAQNLFKKLVDEFPINESYNYNGGLSFYNSSFNQTKSIPYFEAALADTKKDTFVEIYFYLGKAYQLNSEFVKSTNAFNKFSQFIKEQSKRGQLLKADIAKEINYNKNAIYFSHKKDSAVLVENLGTKVNSVDREYAPVIGINKDILLFTSRRKSGGNKIDNADLLPYEDIYIAKKKENGWELLSDKNEIQKYLPPNVNTKKHDASITYSLDGKTIYTYKKSAIWKSQFNNDNWSSLTKLSDEINSSKLNVPSITISTDENTMFFVSTKNDGTGGKDIYKSTRSGNGVWNIPTILNTNINTPEDEDGPFLTKDGNTLYFSSKGHNSIGGYDLFKSELINGEWSTPINLGFPFNSPADDIFFSIHEDNQSGFFSSSRVEGNGSFDIYEFKYPCKNIDSTEIRGLVYDKETLEPLVVNIEATNLKDQIKTSSTSNSHGKFLIITKPENQYEISIECKGFTKQTFNITIPKQCDFYPLFSEIQLEISQVNGKAIQAITAYNSFFNRNEIPDDYSVTDTELTLMAKQLPSNSDNSDIHYESDIKLIAKTRKLSNQTIRNFTIIKDTIVTDGLASSIKKELPTFKSVYFDFDKTNINPQSKKDLDDVINYLKSVDGQNLILTINGHADAKRDSELAKSIFSKIKAEFTPEMAEQRSKDYNNKLSKKRAEQISNYLIFNGVKSHQLIIDYFGEDNPALPNRNTDGTNNLENQKLNRRVSFKLIEKTAL